MNPTEEDILKTLRGIREAMEELEEQEFHAITQLHDLVVEGWKAGDIVRASPKGMENFVYTGKYYPNYSRIMILLEGQMEGQTVETFTPDNTDFENVTMRSRF